MLFRFILAIYTCFLSLLQYGYPHTISIKSIDIPDELIYHLDINTRVIKDDSQKFTGTCSLGHSYLCKDNVCVCIEEIYNKPFIEFPDKDNYIHKYILIPFAPFYKNVISQYIKSNKNETIHVSTDCKTDTQCFSNKCINNTCTFNIEANIERCDVLYTHPTVSSRSEEYVNCGRMLGESCNRNDD